MDIFQVSHEKLKSWVTMQQFARTSVESILHKPYVKLALNKLRWVPITMGISHYLLPEMPLLDFIIISTSIEELIHKGDEFSQTAYYRILSVRNILVLLQKAYTFNDCIKDFYNLSISQVTDVAREYDISSISNLPHLFEEFTIKEADSIQKMADIVLSNIEPIVELADYKDSTCSRLAVGSEKEQNILTAYELFYIFFHLIFAKVFENDYSEDVLGKKYHCTDIWNDYELKFINGIRK